MITGLRRGEQLQLTWNDVYEMEVEESRTRTVELINSPLESFARITKNLEDVTTKVADATTGFMDKSGPAVKVAGAIISAAGMKKSRAKKKKKKAE